MTYILDIAESYYKALGNKDEVEMQKYLHPDIHFVGPLADMKGKDLVLTSATKMFSFFKTLKIRAKFSSSDQVMIVYDLECPAPVGLFRAAALMNFQDDLISRIELFYDARPFDLPNPFATIGKP